MMTATMMTSDGDTVLFDEEDRYLIEMYPSWSSRTGRTRSYVKGARYMGNYEQELVLLHRLVTHAPPGSTVDHINHDPLDNRKSNLRVLTASQNSQNRKGLDSNNTSGYRGVTYHKASRKWLVQCVAKKVHYYGGLYESAEAANQAAIALRLEVMTHSDGR